MSRILWLASVLGLGHVPVLPGTAGTLPGLALVWWLSRWSTVRQALVALLLGVAAVPLADAASGELGGHDPASIVIDELVAFPVAALGLPCARHPSLLAVAFLAYRAFDIVKPGPVGWAEGVPGGAGIVLDDLAAALLALPVGWLAFGWLTYRARGRRAMLDGGRRGEAGEAEEAAGGGSAGA